MSDMCMVLFVYSIDYPPVFFNSLPWEARANLKMCIGIELDGLDRFQSKLFVMNRGYTPIIGLYRTNLGKYMVNPMVITIILW